MLANRFYECAGAKCERGIQTLEKYQKDKVKPNGFFLENTYIVVKNFDRIISEKGQFKLKDDDKYIQLIHGNPDGEERLGSMVQNIKTTKIILEKLRNNQKVNEGELKTGINFLKDIGEKCIQYEVETTPFL